MELAAVRFLARGWLLPSYNPLSSTVEWEMKVDRRTDSYFTFDGDRSFVGAHHILHDFCSEPRSTNFPADNLCGEQRVPHIRRHPSPRVCDGDHEGVRFDVNLSTHRHGSTSGDLRNGVIDHVLEGIE